MISPERSKRSGLSTAGAEGVPDARSMHLALEIVIVSYRSGELLRSCLESIDAHPFTDGRVATTVVDNNSGDGTREMLKREFPGIHTELLSENVGFAAANNLALRRATAPYVLLLNPDTELRTGVLDHLVRHLERDPSIGMIGPRLERRDGTFDHAAKRSFPTPLAALAHFSGLGRRARASTRLAQYRAPTLGEHDVGDVDAVNGAFMLVRREALEQVGLLDPGYWLYMEDLDWCYRFHERGWRVVYDGRVSVLHVKGGTTAGGRPPRQTAAFHRGMGRFYRKFFAGERHLVDVLVYCGIVAKGAFSVARAAVLATRSSDAKSVNLVGLEAATTGDGQAVSRALESAEQAGAER